MNSSSPWLASAAIRIAAATNVPAGSSSGAAGPPCSFSSPARSSNASEKKSAKLKPPGGGWVEHPHSLGGPFHRGRQFCACPDSYGQLAPATLGPEGK